VWYILFLIRLSRDQGGGFFMGKKRTKQRTEAKVAVIREHFLLLTGDLTEAAVLNQLLFWTDIVNKNDEQLIDEIEELEKQGKIQVAKEKENEIREGWFFKSAKKLSEEIMLAAPSTVGKKLQSLEKKGLIQGKRSDDPNEAKYYKVNLPVLRSKLLEIGFTLKGEILDLQRVEQAEVKGQRKVEKGSRKKKKEEKNKGSNPPPIEDGHAHPSSNGGTPPLLEDTPSPMEEPPSLMEDKKITGKDHGTRSHEKINQSSSPQINEVDIINEVKKAYEGLIDDKLFDLVVIRVKQRKPNDLKKYLSTAIEEEIKLLYEKEKEAQQQKGELLPKSLQWQLDHGDEQSQPAPLDKQKSIQEKLKRMNERLAATKQRNC
jgi:hypothetical protein